MLVPVAVLVWATLECFQSLYQSTCQPQGHLVGNAVMVLVKDIHDVQRLC